VQKKEKWNNAKKRWVEKGTWDSLMKDVQKTGTWDSVMKKHVQKKRGMG
jgi:hypothetical protein